MANTLNNILSAEYIRNEYFSLYHNGMPHGAGIGLPDVDNIIRWETGRLSVITGIPNFGKSEFIDFLTIRLNRLHGWKTLYFSPENYPVGYHLQKLVSKIADKPFHKNSISVNESNSIIDYITQNFFFLNYETVNTLNDILTCAQQLIGQHGIKILVIDPFNRLEHQRLEHLTETEYISRLLDQMTNFAKKYNILIHLVAHPRKMNHYNGQFDVPTYYDINGSANFANKADYCIAVHRNKAEQTTEIHVQKVKFKNLGCQGTATLKYNLATGNYYQEADVCFDDADDDHTPKTALQSLQQKALAAVATPVLPRPIVPLPSTTNVLDVAVSYFTSIKNTVGKEINLYSYLKTKDENIDLPHMRTLPNFKDLKATLPAVTISGVFKGGRKIENYDKTSGLICLDIDKKDQIKSIETIFDELKQMSNVAYVGYSCSGEGLFAIIPVRQPHCFLQHFRALQKDMAERQIIIDPACSDVTRLRFYAYDADAYFNPQADAYTNLFTPTQRPSPTEHPVKIPSDVSINDKRLQKTITDIQQNHINIAESYNEWRDLAIIFNNAFGEEGRDVFHAVSAQSKKYDPTICDAEYNKISARHYNQKNIASFYYMYNRAKRGATP